MGPKRAPGRYDTPESNGMPAIATAARPVSCKRGSRANVSGPAAEAGPGQPQPEPQPQPARTLWRPLRKTPLRQFLQTETGSAAILAAAVLAALVWANVSNATYRQVWDTELALHVGSHGMSM